MKRFLMVAALLGIVAAERPTRGAAQGVATAEPEIKLVLLIAVDQFRGDYLSRFDAEYKGGIRRLMSDGAVFTSAKLEHYPTVTAVGHAAMLSGAIPADSGIIGNDWFDRESGAIVTSVSDNTVQVLGGTDPASAASPSDAAGPSSTRSPTDLTVSGGLLSARIAVAALPFSTMTSAASLPSSSEPTSRSRASSRRGWP